MTTPTIQAQEVITCDLCTKPTQQFCINCQVSLCVDCVSKHVDKLDSLPHDIVPFRDRKVTVPGCEFHPSQKYGAYCQQCDAPVCQKCLLGPHNGHKVKNMPARFHDKKKEVEKETKDIESAIDPQYKKRSEETESNTVAELDSRSQTKLTSLLDQIKSITTIPTGFNPLYNVACVGVDEAWVSGKDKTIRRVDIHGSVRDTVTTTCKTWPDDITVTRQGELVYSDANKSTVNIVRHERTEKLMTTPQGWIPGTLCCSKSGDILVSMFTTGFSQRKIVRYQGHTSIAKQEIDRDEDGKPIYKGGKYPLCVVDNNNGDIVASDSNANTVVAVNNSGRVRFRYDGTPARRKRSFDPGHIVTDSMSQIIVTDINNDCLHILDQNGQFLRCVSKCGLVRPDALSVDIMGRLWVGLHTYGTVKVIQYMK
ncbi:uncharacterized protein LOC125655015 [Ostrea edulis]|uniref:uncharacterized protein LOC125655015 n=1 Tax=Ostrea edulis TaxID=37623 RepID=UPI0024AEA671|nr:uncharacterized protein LOC125655015 [Ostrea edulis]XP_048741086.2 uncharacterized protein LOC125655015 [Ostrea edulis]